MRIANLILAVALLAWLSQSPTSASTQTDNSCSKRSVDATSRAYYQDLIADHRASVWIWQVHSCGGTSLYPVSERFPKIFRPCPSEAGWRCFGSQRTDESWILYLALPRDFSGGNSRWHYNRTQFASKILVAPLGDLDEVVLIEARGEDGGATPYLQRFVYSLKNGVVAASVIDAKGRAILAQAAIDGRGVFDAVALRGPEPEVK